MPRALRILLLSAAAALALFALVLALAWAFLPRRWIREEAARQTARMSGVSVRFKDLSPGMQGLSLGVRVTDLEVRVPARGDEILSANLGDVFVRLKLFPLLFRRVEVAAASVRDASIVFTDRGPRPEAPPKAEQPRIAVVLPKLEFDRVRFSSRDAFGAGFDFKNVSGSASFEGTLPKVRSLRVDARAESVLWKPSARGALVPLPGPLDADVRLGAVQQGKVLRVTKGSIHLGKLASALGGAVTLADPAGRPASLDLTLRGREDHLKSDDEAWKPLTSRLPATLEGAASWEVRIEGPAATPTTNGSLKLKPLSVSAGKNRFDLSEVRAAFRSSPDRTFRASADGNGSGVTLSLRASGSTLPGGKTVGTFAVVAPAQRLNGLVPNAPNWDSGRLECRAVFTLEPPSTPVIRWTVTGRDLKGTAPGVPRPITGLRFDLDGDATVANVREIKGTIGSTTATVRGTVTRGKPLGTGRFQVALDRFVVEEWTPPASAKRGVGAAERGKAAPPPPIPLRSLDASVAIGEVRSGGMRVQNLVAPVHLSGGTLAVSPITGAIGTGRLEGTLDVRSLLTSPEYALHMDVRRAPVQEVARGVLPFGSSLTGLLSGTIDLSGPGIPGPEASESLRGALAGTVEDGKILESPTVAGLRKALGATHASDLAFRTIAHSLRIDRGRMILDRVRGDLGQDLFDLTGSIGLDQSLDLKLLLRLAPSRLEGGGSVAQIARYARDEQGRVPVEVGIGGTARAPKLSIRPAKAVETATKAIRQKLTTDLTKNLARRDTTRAEADSSRPDPLQQGRDALKRLLGK